MHQAPNQNYVATPSASPQYSELAPTPSPETMNYPYRNQPVNFGNNFNAMNRKFFLVAPTQYLLTILYGYFSHKT